MSNFDELICTWVKDYDGFWLAQCGLAWWIDDGSTPQDHSMSFCPGCGRKLVTHANEKRKEPTDWSAA